MNALSAGVPTMKIASIDNYLSLRLVINGADVTVAAHEVDPFHSTADQVTDFAVSELRKLRDRLNSFSDTVRDHQENGGFPADFPVMREVESFYLEHIRLTRRYWRTANAAYSAQLLQQCGVNGWRRQELARIAMARAARVRVHLRVTLARLCPPIIPTIADQALELSGSQLLRADAGSAFRLPKTPIAHILRLFTPAPKSIKT